VNVVSWKSGSIYFFNNLFDSQSGPTGNKSWKESRE
jgi:hypothetical protein